MKTRNPILGDWELCGYLGRRRDYVMYRARHCSSRKEAYLRVLPSSANAEARECFDHAVSLASGHPEFFLPVTSISRCGAAIIAVSDIPDRTLASSVLSPSIDQLARLCCGLAGGLELVHGIGRIHAYLVPESVEVVGEGSTDVQLRFLDIGRGLPMGRICVVEADSDLPPEVGQDNVASVSWDVYGFGRLGQHLLRQANASGVAEGVRLALEALLQACSSTREQRRPRSMQIVAKNLCDIVKQIDSSALEPEEPSAASSLTRRRERARADSDQVGSDGSDSAAPRSLGMSQSGRILASLLSLAAVVALGVVVASMIGISILSL